jgi:glucose/arabinose dehydrogenase
MITLGVGGLAIPAVISRASAAVPVLPAGFALESTPTGQAANLLTGFVELPTGGAITIGKCGKVTFVPVAAPPRQLATVPASCAQDLGLVGVALPPDFSTSRRVYTLYSYLGSDGVRYARLSYWLLDNVTQPTTMTSEQVIPLGQVAEDGQGLSHGPGTVLFAPDGTIYLGLGDSASFFVVDAKSNRAQDPASPYGKIFHIDTAGNGVPGNPYYDPANPASWRSRVFAMGMRNPFRFTIHSATGRLFLGDVGWNSWEEQDVAVPGSNFGWPAGRAPDTPPDTTPQASAPASMPRTPGTTTRYTPIRTTGLAQRQSEESLPARTRPIPRPTAERTSRGTTPKGKSPCCAQTTTIS